MTKIAILLHWLRPGGAERVMLNLSHGLLDRGFDVDLLLVRAEGEFISTRDPRTRLVNLEAARALDALPALRRYLRREQPAVILSNLPHLNLLALFGRGFFSRQPRLVLVHHSDLGIASAHGVRRWEQYYPFVLRFINPFADRFVAVSTGVADALVKKAGVPRKKITVIYNPIALPEIQRLASAPLEHPWFNPGEPPVILAVGRLTAAKDYPTLLRAFALLCSRRAARLTILGNGELRGELEALASSLGIAANMEFAGYQANPYAFMRHAALLALSSAWEGFGNVLVEALACGTQVVSTNCHSGPAEILDGGKYGRLVPVGDDHAMAEALENALDHPLPPEALRERAKAFSVEAALERYLPLLTGEKA